MILGGFAADKMTNKHLVFDTLTDTVQPVVSTKTKALAPWWNPCIKIKDNVIITVDYKDFKLVEYSHCTAIKIKVVGNFMKCAL